MAGTRIRLLLVSVDAMIQHSVIPSLVPRSRPLEAVSNAGRSSLNFLRSIEPVQRQALFKCLSDGE